MTVAQSFDHGELTDSRQKEVSFEASSTDPRPESTIRGVCLAGGCWEHSADYRSPEREEPQGEVLQGPSVPENTRQRVSSGDKNKFISLSLSAWSVSQ